MQRTLKHLSRKERFFAEPRPGIKLVKVPSSELEGQELISAKNMPLLFNQMIDNGDAYVEHVVQVMQSIHDQLGNDKKVVVCSLCAKRIGVKRCANCPGTTVRYCSRRCQVADWPQHKACCGERKGNFIDVE
jgi:hypothetical protein